MSIEEITRMWMKALAVGAILLFLVWITAVLQGWSKSSASNRLTGMAFAVVFGAAALWGVRTLFWR